MSLSRICHEHPCLKPYDEGPCHKQRPLGIMGSVSLCAENQTDCPYYHELEYGCYDFEDTLFLANWEECLALKTS